MPEGARRSDHAAAVRRGREADETRAYFSSGVSVRERTSRSFTQSSSAPAPSSHHGRSLTRMLPISSHCWSGKQERRHGLLLGVQRRHVDHQLLGVYAFMIEQDEVDLEPVQLVRGVVVEHEHRAAALVGVLELVELDRASAASASAPPAGRGQEGKRRPAPQRLARGGRNSRGAASSDVVLAAVMAVSSFLRRLAPGQAPHRLILALHSAQCAVQCGDYRSMVVPSLWGKPSGLVATPGQMGSEMSKTARGNFFEDFVVGQEIHHATPRTVTEGDAALYLALTGSRFAVHCSGDARAHGRAAAAAARGSPDLPPGVRPHRARRLAERGRQSRLCRWPLRRAALPRRHPDRELRGDRPQGELQRRERHGLRAHARDQGRRPPGARVRALGHGHQARPREPGAGAGRARAAGPRRGRAAHRAGGAAAAPLRPGALGLDASLRQLRGRRAHRSRRRHDHRRGRAPPGDPAVPEPGARPLRRAAGARGPLRPLHLSMAATC